MIKLFLFSFLPPKIMQFYLYELIVIIYSLNRACFNKIVLNRFKHLKELRLYLEITCLFFVFQFVVIIFRSIRANEFLFFEMIFTLKMAVYFLLVPLFSPVKLALKFKQNIDFLFYLFFGISFAVFVVALQNSQISSMLWNPYEFGNRFVGFTGSSLGLNGLEVVGSTANSVGILYCLFFNYFFYRKSSYQLPCFLSILGVILTLSQGAMVVLIVSMIIHFFSKPTNLRIYTLVVVFGAVGLVFNSIIFDHLFFRIDQTLADIEQMQLPSSLNDRVNQWDGLISYVSQCPSALLIGLEEFQSSSCGVLTIYESYFLDVFARFGMTGLLLSIVQLILTLRIWHRAKSLKIIAF